MKEENEAEEIEFNWSEYLKQTNSEAAPSTCFRQYEQPPENLFKKGEKIETVDPRNTSSICIGTIIEKQGPRLRLRLDGTDDRNDFWLLVDSDQIHPFGFTTKRGGTINPPLGFRNNLSTWPRFFDKIVQSNESIFADEKCFKATPPKPPTNEFKRGQKLEAVDIKNPHLICPATITDVNKQRIFIAFDGWSQSSSFWCDYASRDIFPVGWCKLAQHPLQSPGNLDEKKQSKTNRRLSRPSQTNKQNTSDATDSSLNENKSPIKGVMTTKNDNTSPSKQPIQPVPMPSFDLSLIKTEAIDHELNDTHNTTVTSSHVLNKPKTQSQENQIPKVSIYVNTRSEVGDLIDREKFFSTYKKFGPDTPKHIFRCVLQAFIDCAYDSTRIFELMPDGDSTSYMKYKNENRSEKKYLPKIENDKQLWHNLRLMSKLLSTDDNLFSKKKDVLLAQKVTNCVTNDQNGHLQEAKVPEVVQQQQQQQQQQHHHQQQQQQHQQQQKLKRQSSTSDETNLQNHKIFKPDVNIDNPYYWSVEQVSNYVKENDPNLCLYADALRHQEIDGKALMLLTTEIMMKYLGLKLGPALKFANLIDKLKKSCKK